VLVCKQNSCCFTEQRHQCCCLHRNHSEQTKAPAAWQVRFK
jgi:hypothetical protein